MGRIATADGYLMPCSFFHGCANDDLVLDWIEENNVSREDLKIDGRSLDEIDNTPFMTKLNESLQTEKYPKLCRHFCYAERELGNDKVSNWKTIT